MSEDRLSLGAVTADKYFFSLWRGLLLISILTVLLIMGFEKTAHAAFPGENGNVAFVSDRDGNAEIYVMNADGSGQRRLTDNSAAESQPAVSPDGTKIAFQSDRSGDDEIYVMDADGSNQIRLTNSPSHDQAPAFSPDGTKIAFSSPRDGNGGNEIYVMDADGSNQTRLTNRYANDADPDFSPDGTKIVFASEVLNGTYQNDIHVMDSDGSNQTELTTNAHENDSEPSFSPDGSSIVYQTYVEGNETTAAIKIMNTDGSSQNSLTSGARYYNGPTFSPNGTKIAFASYVEGSPHAVHLMNTDGSSLTKLTNNVASDFNPAWGVAKDTTPPNTTITSGPEGTVNNTSANFAFSSTEDGSTFQCSLDGAAFSTCTSPKGFTNLSNGTHTLEVQAIDPAGNVGPATNRSWTVDTVLPTVTGMSPKNASITTDATPTIKATVRDNRTNLQKADMKLYVNGVLISPTKYSYSPTTDVLVYNSPKVAKGKKTVKIVATDAAKNVRTTSWYFTIK